MKLNTTLLGAALITSVLTFTGCTTVIGPESLKDVTQENISQKIIVGKSTKADVTQAFGTPLSQDWDEGSERWIYSYSAAKSSAASYIPVVGLFAQQTEVHGKGVWVYFKKNGVVSDVRVTQTNANVNSGLGR